MNEVYGIVILYVIAMSLITLILYRLHKIDEMQKLRQKIDKINKEYLNAKFEAMDLEASEYAIKELVYSDYSDKEVRDKIKELLRDRNNNSN